MNREGRSRARDRWVVMDRALRMVSRAALVVLLRERRVLVGGLEACLVEGRSKGVGIHDMGEW